MPHMISIQLCIFVCFAYGIARAAFVPMEALKRFLGEKKLKNVVFKKTLSYKKASVKY